MIELITITFLGLFTVTLLALIIAVLNEYSKHKRKQKQQKPSSPVIRPWFISRDYSQRTYATAGFLVVVSQFVARVLIQQGYPVLHSYLAASLPAFILILLVMYLEKFSTVTTPVDNELRELQSRLFAMVGGQRDTAYRLVERERLRHPGKSEWWYWKSAIDVLIADRNRWD